MTNDNLVIIHVPIVESSWHGRNSEELWAEPYEDKPNLFIIRNSPYYLRNISFLDVVFAEKRSDGEYNFSNIVEHKGHSTYRVITEDVSGFEKYWYPIEQLKCTYEAKIISPGRTIYAIDIPPFSFSLTQSRRFCVKASSTFMPSAAPTRAKL